MKRVLCVAALLCLGVPFTFAQNNDHGEFGVFADYFRIGQIDTNFFGVGGRLSFNVHPNIQLEGETAYDFNQSFSTGIPCIGNGCNGNFIRSSVHVWDGLFGPKIQNSGPVRVFATVKGGFVNFAGGNPDFTQQVGTFGGPGTFGALYPGVGLEGYIWKIGLRLDVGDQIYFNNGAQNNLKITFGPTIRF